MRKRPPPALLGDLQLAIMEVLWSRGGATLAEIREALSADRTIATTTIATVLSRLHRAKLVTHSGSERSRIYRAVAPREDVQKLQTRRLIDRFFGGRPSELVQHLVRDADVDEAELAEVRRILRQRRRP